MVQRRLLEIAIREFAAKGIDGTSTRGIAGAAGTTMSSITYHYGSKKGMYLAAADHIAAQMAEGFDLAKWSSPNDPAMARSGIIDILHKLIDKLMVPHGVDWSLFIMREQMSPTEAFDRIHDGMMRQMLETLISLVTIATGVADEQTVRLVVVTLFGQALVIRAARGACSRVLPQSLTEPGLIDAFKSRIVANTHAILDGLIVAQR